MVNDHFMFSYILLYMSLISDTLWYYGIELYIMVNTLNVDV